MIIFMKQVYANFEIMIHEWDMVKLLIQKWYMVTAIRIYDEDNNSDTVSNHKFKKWKWGGK